MALDDNRTYDALDELIELGGLTKTVTCGKHSITVRELTLHQIRDARQALRPLIADTIAQKTLDEIAMDHLDDIIVALSVATGWPVERLAKLPGSRIGEVIAALWEVNGPFFVVIMQLLSTVTRATDDTAGQTRTSTSGEQDAPTPAA